MNHDTAGISRYENLLKRALSNFVEFPDRLKIKVRSDQSSSVMISISPSGFDFGKVLGKKRQTLTALEVLLVSIARQRGDRIQLHLIEPDIRVQGIRGIGSILNPSWSDKQDQQMAVLLADLINIALLMQVKILTTAQDGETILTIAPKNTHEEVPVEMIGALHTIMRAIGATAGRRLTVNAKSDESSSQTNLGGKEGHSCE